MEKGKIPVKDRLVFVQGKRHCRRIAFGFCKQCGEALVDKFHIAQHHKFIAGCDGKLGTIPSDRIYGHRPFHNKLQISGMLRRMNDSFTLLVADEEKGQIPGIKKTGNAIFFHIFHHDWPVINFFHKFFPVTARLCLNSCIYCNYTALFQKLFSPFSLL